MKKIPRPLVFLSVFLISYWLPLENDRVTHSILEAFYLLRDYAQHHVILCLIPAFFIAGALAIFISQGNVIKYFGPKAKKTTAYLVASVSGTLLAICSCTVLPLFSGIYKKGAGLGPAITFLYSGPAINLLAIILTTRVLGIEIGLARGIGAIVFSVVIGLIMAAIYRKEDMDRLQNGAGTRRNEETEEPMGYKGLLLGSLVVFLVFANWGKPSEPVGFFNWIFNYKWVVAAGALIVILYTVMRFMSVRQRKDWLEETWDFAQQILPLLFFGVLFAGLLMGRPGLDQGLIPYHYVATLVGGNSLFANFFASVVGALMYFATLTEIPIVQGLMGAGMGKGPALALLLAGPALSLPNLLVIRRVLGTKKTMTFAGLVVFFSTLTGMLYGYLF
ncbi:MAG: permease [delta proteobacterium ML8_F1]|nr:MAG: permease [delta proteobacterium ML8_F1]